MLRAFVLHWSPLEVQEKVAAVEKAGAIVCGFEAEDGARAGKRIMETGPDVLVVWTSRLPSHGRVTAAYVRSTRWGKGLPLLFVHEDPEPLAKDKRKKLGEVLPDAVLVTPRTLAVWLRKVEEAIEARKRPLPGDGPAPAKGPGNSPAS